MGTKHLGLGSEKKWELEMGQVSLGHTKEPGPLEYEGSVESEELRKGGGRQTRRAQCDD